MTINETLYGAIIERFGEATVTKEGEPMVSHYEAASSSGIPSLRITQFGESYCVKCPFCESEKRCLAINHQFGKYDQQTGYRYLHLAKCFRKNCLADPLRRQKLADMLLGMVNRDRRGQDKQRRAAAPQAAAEEGRGGDNDPAEASAAGNDGRLFTASGVPAATPTAAHEEK